MRAITNSSGTVANSYSYDAYGNTTSSSGSVLNQFKYAGEYQDAESTLYYLRARYYDPATQQFLTVDPMVGLTGQPYAYVGGSPTNLTDPSGRCIGPLIFVCLAIGAAILEGGGAILIEMNTEEDTEKAAQILNGATETGDATVLLDESLAQKLSQEGETLTQGSEEGADCETNYLYRGVSANHPEIEAAKRGKVIPGDINGTATAEEHNLNETGDVVARSPFTSWTRNIEIARWNALKEGAGGVILRFPTGAPPTGATWHWEWSPDWFGEQEVLLWGTRNGAEVLQP